MISFKIEPKENPYLYDEREVGNLWGEISLVNNDELLFSAEWDVLMLIVWFAERENTLKEELFPLEETEGSCIAEKYDVALNELADIDEELGTEYVENILREYSPNHYCFLRGSKLPDFYVGINSGLGEVSYYDEQMQVYKSFVFDMTIFLENIKKIGRDFVREWSSKYYTLEGYMRIIEVEKQFGIKIVED